MQVLCCSQVGTCSLPSPVDLGHILALLCVLQLSCSTVDTDGAAMSLQARGYDAGERPSAVVLLVRECKRRKGTSCDRLRATTSHLSANVHWVVV
jgi:hypothetical protein